ncbi:MAG: BMP family ABC transporter substrate-binding protein [Spirochaetales bacterium]|nr:BMP family ABC transporter substrate-binding protein [Spirochaetales bacterium]
MTKKSLKKLLVVAFVALFTTGAIFASGSQEADTQESGAQEASVFKVGVIYVGDENEGYTEAHMKGIEEMKSVLGLSDSQVIEKANIPESEACYDAAVDLASQGCSLIIANSFGHEDYMLQAAKEYPEVQFCHATGYQAGLSGLSNMHNFMPAVYQSRYVAGVAAGLKLNDMIANGTITAEDCKMGYVGAYPYAEVVSGYTSFYLGVKSVCPTATMVVRYTNSWADMTLEKETADALIAEGCVLISQHADTTGAPTACEAKNIPMVGYNVDMTTVAPNSAITSAALNWGAYYAYAAKLVKDGETVPVDWSKGYTDDAVYITPINTNVAAAGTQERVDEVIAAIKSGDLNVFNTSTFTVNGEKIEDLIAAGGDFEKYGQYVSDGYFHEQEIGSAPAFDLRIDGITELTN